MRYKGIISDADETLLNAKKEISPVVADAIDRLIKNGYTFSIASGRAYNELKRFCDELHLVSPQIVRGGAEITDPLSGEVLHAEYMPEKDAGAIIKLLSENAIPFYVEQEDLTYTTTPNPANKNRIFRDLSELTRYSEIPKIVLLATGMDIRKMEEFADNRITAAYPGLHAIKSYGANYKVWDITSAKATKQLAVFKLAEIMGCSPKDFIGVGDGYNDFPLLEACGLKVAMGNANEQLKEIADYIAPEVDRDGLADVIEKYFPGAAVL